MDVSEIMGLSGEWRHTTHIVPSGEQRMNGSLSYGT
jgi:hypothetical protein